MSVTQTQSGRNFLNSFCGASPPQGHLLYVESVMAPDSIKGRSDAFTPTRRGELLRGSDPSQTIQYRTARIQGPRDPRRVGAYTGIVTGKVAELFALASVKVLFS